HRFYAEVRPVSRPGAILAVWSYHGLSLLFSARRRRHARVGRLSVGPMATRVRRDQGPLPRSRRVLRRARFPVCGTGDTAGRTCRPLEPEQAAGGADHRLCYPALSRVPGPGATGGVLRAAITRLGRPGRDEERG